MNSSALPTLRIRRAVADDLDALVALEQRSFNQDRLSRAQYRRHLDSDSAQILVARSTPVLLGAAVLFFRRRSRIARLYSLAIDTTARGRGLGKAMLEACEQVARRRHCNRVRLEVRDDNAAAIALYERGGFTRLEPLRGYYDDGSDGWRYQKLLT